MGSDEQPEELQGVSPDEVWESLDADMRERTLRLLVELMLRISASQEENSEEKTSYDPTSDDLSGTS
jgi:hypothetical protein